MTDDIAVLGIATSSSRGVLTVYRVIVRLSDDGVAVEPMEPWQGTAADETRSMGDLVDALANTLDRKRDGAPQGLAAKRTESTLGRPSNPYDQKIRAEGVAMVAASSQGRPYFAYRTNQLTKGDDLRDQAARHDAYPATGEARDALAAACEALAELRGDREADV
jgi:hypothetical protein